MIHLLDRFIAFCFGLLFLAVPLAMTPWNYELFEFNKMLLVYALTAVIVGTWLVKIVVTKTWNFVRTPLDIPLWLFVGSQLVSSLFSIDPHLSWLGYYSRFNGGMWSVICYVLLYHAFVSNIKNEKMVHTENVEKIASSPAEPGPRNDIFILLKLILAGAGAVSVYGVLQRMGIDKHLWVQDVQNRVFSTLGQPNWLAAYLTALLPIMMATAMQKIPNPKHQILNKSEKQNNKAKTFLNLKNLNFGFILDLGFWISNLLTLLFFYVLLNTRSRSGLIGFTIADLFLICLSLWKITTETNDTQRKSEIRSTKSEINYKFQISNFKSNPRDKFKNLLNSNYWKLLLPHLAVLVLVFFHGTYIPKIDSWITWKGLTNLKSHPPAGGSMTNKVDIEDKAPLEDTIGISESGDIRRYVWEAAVKTWLSSPKVFFIGTGTETFAYAFFQNKPLGHNLTSEWDFLYNKAHNEYLNYLATTGIFGLVSYLIVIGAFILWFIRRQILNSKHEILNKLQYQNAKLKTVLNLGNSNFEFISDLEFRIWDLRLALFAGWLSILVTNFFGFSVVITQLMFFLFPAMIMSMVGAGRLVSREMNLAIFKWRFGQPILTAAITGGVFTVLILVGRTWYADSLFASGYRANRSSQPAEAEKYLRRATQLSPMEPLFADELATTLATLTVSAVESGEATRASELARESIRLSGWATTLSPNNTNYWKNRTKVFYAFAGFDQQFIAAAIESLTNAYKLSPSDPKIVYNLAILYGRAGDNNKAVETLKYALDLKPNYRDAYFALSVFYTELKKPELAKAILREYLTKVDPTDIEFKERTK